MINELDLIAKFHSIGNIFHLWDQIFRIDTCFNVECELLGRNFNFFVGYFVVNARYLVITGGYCSLLGGCWWLLLVTGGYCSLPLVTACSHF